ncbi:MAG: hypothetical protein DMG02_11445 [Acidobacteria bacterium]|nr:MAG: hypothetical protein DMG02_11445 [Acidobacteriota bacterium]
METGMNSDDVHADRRLTARRRGVQDHGVVSAHVRPGHSAVLLNVSAGGALVDTEHRLLPGGAVELQMRTKNDRISMRGRVVRCAVVRLRPAVCYRGAIVFDQYLPWFVDERREQASPEVI